MNHLLRITKEIRPIYWVDNFLSNEEIDKIIEYTFQINPEPSKVGGNIREEIKKPFTPDYHIKNPNIGNVPRIRQSVIKWIELNPDTNWLYKKLISQIHKVNQENFDYILKFVEDLQFTEYNEDQHGFYSKHDDCGDSSRLENFVDIRKLSFTIQLSNPEDYEGGELVFYNDKKEFNAPKNKGTIIFFESNILHEVKPVKKGTRHALVSWVQGPNLR
jgi:PKHD-type hydroxylase